MKTELDLNKLPKHIGLIIDGNGRWAKQRNKPRSYGHKVGAETLEKVVLKAKELGIKVVSIYAFSTENWKRPKEEVDYLFNLFENAVKRRLKQGNFDDGICFKYMGDSSRLPKKFWKLAQELMDKTKNNTDFYVNVGINYGGRDELVRAVNKILDKNLKNITEQDLKNHLDTADLPDLEFVIRTSGEQRISNFMLFQIAYAELYFTKTYWPDFDENELIKALLDFQGRSRSYGAVTEDKKWVKDM